MKLKNQESKRKDTQNKKFSLILKSYILIFVGIAIAGIVLLQLTEVPNQPVESEFELKPTYCPEDSPFYNFPLTVTDLDAQPLAGISIMPLPESGMGCIRSLRIIETDENGETTITSYSDETFSFLIQNATCSPRHHTLELRSENGQVCIVNGNQCTQAVTIQVECE